MTHPLSQLSPTKVWHYFYQLTQIPRPSFEEEAVQQFDPCRQIRTHKLGRF